MTRKEQVQAVAHVLREMTLGRSSEELAAEMITKLRALGLEIVAIPTTPEEKKAAQASEHEHWAVQYDVQAAEFEALGNTIAAENRREMARQSRERVAILRGQGPKRA